MNASELSFDIAISVARAAKRALLIIRKRQGKHQNDPATIKLAAAARSWCSIRKEIRNHSRRKGGALWQMWSLVEEACKPDETPEKE